MKYIKYMAFNSNYGGFGGSSGGNTPGGGQGVPITDPTVIAQLTSNNYTNNTYTGSAILGQQSGDYYDSGTIRYWIVGDTGATRIPYANL